MSYPLGFSPRGCAGSVTAREDPSGSTPGWADWTKGIFLQFRTEREIVFLVLAALWLPTGAEAGEQSVARIALAAGDYEIAADVGTGAKDVRQSKGTLSLRDLSAGNELRKLGYQLYGWSDLDWRKLGAPMDAASTPGNSRDPDSPGVLVLVPPSGFKGFGAPQPNGAPILLVGTLDNKKATRGWQDGAGIGLFVQSTEGKCMSGEWSGWGLVKGSKGRFRICAPGAKTPPNPALNPTGLRPAG
jgi:hypothetical protein